VHDLVRTEAFAMSSFESVQEAVLHQRFPKMRHHAARMWQVHKESGDNSDLAETLGPPCHSDFLGKMAILAGQFRLRKAIVQQQD
jgi:hypothetical protein